MGGILQTKSDSYEESNPERKENGFHFSLPGLLSADYRLVLNIKTNTLSLLADGPLLVQQQQLSEAEMHTLLPILNAFPHACPYTELLTNNSSANDPSTTISYRQQRLEEAQSQGTWQRELKPLRRTLSSLRKKLRTFHLEISTVREMGYSLTMEIK